MAENNITEWGSWECHVSVKKGDQIALEKHLNKNIINNRFQHETLLSTAIKSGFPQIVQWLLKNGANPDLRSSSNGRNETPLVTATRFKNLEIVRLLVENGANIKKISFGGQDAVCQAVIENAFDILEYFLENIEPNRCTHQPQNCPFLIALKYSEQFTGKRKCLFILIRKRYQCECLIDIFPTLNTDISTSICESGIIKGQGLSCVRILKCVQLHITIYFFESFKLANFARASILNALLADKVINSKGVSENFKTLIDKLPLPLKLLDFLMYKNSQNNSVRLLKTSEMVNDQLHQHFVIFDYSK